MANFEINDDYMQWVQDNIIPRFTQENIQVSANALKLIALTMQMQVTEEGVENSEALFERADEFTVAPITEYYKDRYGRKRMTYNRAFHMMDVWGIVLKYPWKRTGGSFV